MQLKKENMESLYGRQEFFTIFSEFSASYLKQIHHTIYFKFSFKSTWKGGAWQAWISSKNVSNISEFDL